MSSDLFDFHADAEPLLRWPAEPFTRFVTVETEPERLWRPGGPRCWAMYGITGEGVPVHVGLIEIGVFGFEFATTKPLGRLRGAAGSLDAALAQVEAAVRFEVDRAVRVGSIDVWLAEMVARVDRIVDGVELAGEVLSADEVLARFDELIADAS